MAGQAPDAIDWPTVHREALDILQRYIRIDTSNPPGNEAPAAHFLGEILEAEGLQCDYIETHPNRELVMTRLRGDGSRGGALLLGNHLDVVPVEEESWDVPPFEGLVRDGRIYGRGALDMKGCGVMQLMTVLLLHRLGVPLGRDVIFLAVPDEEAGSIRGIRWVIRHRPELLDGIDFALNEGVGGITEFAGGEGRIFMPTIDEKGVAWLRLRATGPGGHGSVPTTENPAVRLLGALLRLADWDRGLTFTPGTTALVERLADAGILPDPADRDALDAALRSDPRSHAMFVHTLNVTLVEAGIKANVIPPRAEAVLDCRLLPGEDIEGWMEAVRAQIDDPLVEVEPEARDVYGTNPSDWESELFLAIRDTMTEAVEDAIVVPGLATFATDNRFLREFGIPAYGFIPCLLSPEELSGLHAHNEFLTVDNFEMGTELTYEIVRRVVT
ncbi:MAG: M20/M25/M40 family metallo-hydrolase [Chloroflexi bacterium]|nr:M20/M25/M40 family metallo-hydrolase [Chloroflexota bacterium]